MFCEPCLPRLFLSSFRWHSNLLCLKLCFFISDIIMSETTFWLAKASLKPIHCSLAFKVRSSCLFSESQSSPQAQRGLCSLHSLPVLPSSGPSSLPVPSPRASFLCNGLDGKLLLAKSTSLAPCKNYFFFI